MATCGVAEGKYQPPVSLSCSGGVDKHEEATAQVPDDVGEEKAAINRRVLSYISCLESWPMRKQKMLTDPLWFQENYKTELTELREKMQKFPGLASCLSYPLVVGTDQDLFQRLFYQKLLLREDPIYCEFPSLKKVLKVEMRLDLPRHVIVNPVAEQTGVYVMSEQDQHLWYKHQKLFMTGRFCVQGVLVDTEFPLDFVMSCSEYADACRVAFMNSIIQPNIDATMKSLRKHEEAIARTWRTIKVTRGEALVPKKQT